MKEFSVQFEVNMTLSKVVTANSLEEALKVARYQAKLGALGLKLVNVPRNVEYVFENTPKVMGVYEES